MSESRAAAELAARDGYGRLVAFLCGRCRDLARVEDALSQAFVEALEQWPTKGVPNSPEAWLLTVARRRLIDIGRDRNAQALSLDVLNLAERAAETEPIFPDERLKLLFVCTHPAIDASVQTPLMLQSVLGFPAEAIAKAFLVPAATMGQRLVRAKMRIRDLAIPFAVPELAVLPQRLDAVLGAIYAIYGSAWEDLSDATGHRAGLAAEAFHLTRTLVKLLPEEPEALGLLALILHCEARRPARIDGDNQYVPLARQNVELWSMSLMREAEGHLWKAAAIGRFGRFQLEAAIQSGHNRRAIEGETPWPDILLLYQELVRLHDTVGARVAWAAALGCNSDAITGIALLEALPPEATRNYQPYWAVLAHLSQATDQHERAAAAWTRAIELTDDSRVQQFLHKAALSGNVE